MKSFCFTIDDNIRFFSEITERKYKSAFEHPYLSMLKRLHDNYELKIQLNLFFRMEDFDLSLMSEDYKEEWEKCSDWLKFSFHSFEESARPYENSGYDEVYDHCQRANRQILRFSSEKSLAKTTTVHYCRTTEEGLIALDDNGIKGLLGLFGTEESPRTSYQLDDETASLLRRGQIIKSGGISFGSIDMIINLVQKEKLMPKLSRLLDRDSIRVMIHEQYFYEDYKKYQADFEEKLSMVFDTLTQQGYKSCFFEELI